jgi:hypothetical protein
MSQTFYLISPQVRMNAEQAVRSAPDGYVVTIKEAKRTVAQNARLWALLTDVAEQVDWYGQKLSNTDWKDIFTASLRKSRVVPGIDQGTFVVTGLHTSNMTKAEHSDLTELIVAFGTERGVVFHDGWEE